MVWMLVGLLGFVCSGFATERAGGAWMGDGTENGEVRTITLPGGATMDLVWVAPGSFQMGSNDGNPGEKPVHKVTLTKGYWIGKFEVTQKQWQSVMGNNPSHFKGDDLPVECVSWNDCQEFFEKVNSMNPALRVSLPTEAQWAFAARGGTRSLGFEYAGSNNPKEVGWFEENSGGLFSSRKTHPVGKKKPNELGLYDMSGNVCEWCQDWYGDYPSGAVADPTGLSSGDYRVLRGGSWLDNARCCRSANRGGFNPGYRDDILGFRVVASAGP